MKEEKRIYAVVAEKVSTPTKGEVIQVPGRMAAQAVHAVSRMKMNFLFGPYLGKANKKAMAEAQRVANESTTLIIKSCRDTKELLHTVNLVANAKISACMFCDHNEEVYGPAPATGIYTAFATVPVTKEQVAGILDYLPLAFTDMVKKPVY